MLHYSPSALELTPGSYCSFVLIPPTPSIVFLIAVKKCAMPLSEPLVDLRPRSEMVRRSDVTWGPRGYRHTRKKPLVSSKNNKKRLEYANRYVIWTHENWAKIFFSDESKFNLFGNDGKNNVKRRIGERLSAKCTKKTVKFGGRSAMVFGMFSSQGTTPLVRLQTHINAQIYKNTVQDHVVPIIQNSGFNRATFMQDNAPCHKAKVVMSYLIEQDFEIMDWPPQNPDLNPIENLWKTLGVKVMERNPTNTEDLWVKLQEEWSKISIEDCQELIRSCSRRCAAVIESKGSFTKY